MITIAKSTISFDLGIRQFDHINRMIEVSDHIKQLPIPRFGTFFKQLKAVNKRSVVLISKS